MMYTTPRMMRSTVAPYCSIPVPLAISRLWYRKAAAMNDVRVDKWLWAARFFKSRTLAAAACSGGKVDVNDQAAKPSRVLRPGDIVRITLPRGKRIVRVSALSDRRGSGVQAALLYEDL